MFEETVLLLRPIFRQIWYTHSDIHSLDSSTSAHTRLVFYLNADADVNSDVLHVGRPAELGRGRGRHSSQTSSEIVTLDSAVSG